MSIVLTDADAPIVVPPQIPQITKAEAEIFAAYKGVLQRYNLAEALRCLTCFEANRPDGCRAEINEHVMRIECRCGVREWHPPKGTTDLPWHRNNSALVLGNQTTSTRTLEDGSVTEQPATILEKEDAAIFRKYWRVLDYLKLSPRLFHWPCWNQNTNDANALLASVTADQIVLMCPCRTLFYQGATL